MTRGGDGIGVMGWTYKIYNRDDWTKMALCSSNEGYSQTWATGGGYRLNNSEGVYRLNTDTTYLVSMDVNLTRAPITTEAMTDINTSSVYLGYGCWNAPNDTNAVNTMAKKLFEIINIETDATHYTVNSSVGNETFSVASGWRTFYFVFTTPKDFGTYDNALSFYSVLWPGAQIFIDNVRVSHLTKQQSVIIYKDTLHSDTFAQIGNYYSSVDLPIIYPERNDVKFKGWYTSQEISDSTAVPKYYKYPSEVAVLYAGFDILVTVSFVDETLNTSELVSGKPNEALVYPKTPTCDGKTFLGWYKDREFTVPFDSAVIPDSSITVYAKWEDNKPAVLKGDIDGDKSISTSDLALLKMHLASN
ncbi:MAG: InlB B-repeat-containing protein [Acutalibacteraceae bacterium]|nr:InlB B-repeat-containing protein [Acutalibacteraceae bacterium]